MIDLFEAVREQAKRQREEPGNQPAINSPAQPPRALPLMCYGMYRLDQTGA